MTTMTGSEAREFWKALMDNASALVADARVLFDIGSFGRARSLSVLAQEELGKALWINETFHEAWNHGDNSSRTVDRLAKHGRDHVRKYQDAVVYGDELAMFWGDYSNPGGRREGESYQDAASRRTHEAKHAADQANLDKQRGFYVDRDQQGAIYSPTQVENGNIADDLQVAAQVIEMLLIEDHSRMKLDAVTPYDSTHPQQSRLLPISHPEDFQAWAGQQSERETER